MKVSRKFLGDILHQYRWENFSLSYNDGDLLNYKFMLHKKIGTPLKGTLTNLDESLKDSYEMDKS